MMNNHNNFLLTIHMKNEKNVTEIHLNKKRQVFTFFNDECISDLILPDYKIDNLNTLLESPINANDKDDNYYAEYQENDEIVREYDKERIGILNDLVTKIDISDFLAVLNSIEENTYYIDSIQKAYNCTVPSDVKKVLSYTTNGVDFNNSNMHFLSHKQIVDNNKLLDHFIPFILKNEKNYIGYNYKNLLYVEYSDKNIIKEGKTLKELLDDDGVEYLFLDNSEFNNKQKKNSDIIDNKEKIIEEKSEESEKVDFEQYENTIRNIDYQIEKLNVGLNIEPNKVEVSTKSEVNNDVEVSNKTQANSDVETNNKEKELKKNNVKSEKKQKEQEKEKIKEEIVEEVRKSLAEIEKTNKMIDEIDQNFEKANEKEENHKNKNDDLLFQSFLKFYEKNITKHKKQKDFQQLLSHEDKILKQKQIKKEIVDDVRKSLNEIEENIKKEQKAKDFHDLLLHVNKINKEKQFQELLSRENSIQKENKEIKLANELVTNSFDAIFDNYKINFNDTQTLIVEHLPYYEISSKFDVIQIPEIELEKLTLIPDLIIDFNKIKIQVTDLTKNNVKFAVKSANSIVDQDNNKIKRGTVLELDLSKELNLRLNKNMAMETWSIKMEKSTFKRELRNIDYAHVMKIITSLNSYKKLGNIEKYELEKSIMLFINFVMENNEIDKLEELYRILEEEPSLYEEYVTRYNIKKTLENNTILATYENKKEFVSKLNYINGLINAKWLDYPRYIFGAFNYFYEDYFLKDFIDELDETIQEEDFGDYLKNLFNEYQIFTSLDEVGKENLNNCINYLSVLYKCNPNIGEENKYKIEKEFMIGADEEEMALLISKLCRRGITDYSTFIDYDNRMKEYYRLGKLKYPLYSESFGTEKIRNGGEYDEF